MRSRNKLIVAIYDKHGLKLKIIKYFNIFVRINVDFTTRHMMLNNEIRFWIEKIQDNENLIRTEKTLDKAEITQLSNLNQKIVNKLIELVQFIEKELNNLNDLNKIDDSNLKDKKKQKNSIIAKQNDHHYFDNDETTWNIRDFEFKRAK
ncbi:hypothetical protein BpHYR1_053290 [Brachionus plicatilis]|uniref:Uncharacterized protein n=1 Tax=Brachionus plicatilis TaxID=10195 RepID=A0A3M7RIV8_BRAPC|nr:hypothetical protein BpHYR1_053290 [Brachionus plicatilis]